MIDLNKQKENDLKIALFDIYEEQNKLEMQLKHLERRKAEKQKELEALRNLRNDPPGHCIRRFEEIKSLEARE